MCFDVIFLKDVARSVFELKKKKRREGETKGNER